MSDSVDKRAYCRFKVPGACGAYRVQGAASRDYIPYEVLNMSKGGLAIHCQTPVPPGTVLYVLLTMPDEEPLELYAKARWHSKEISKNGIALGIEYYPFDSAQGRYGYNPYQARQTLERLEARHVHRPQS